MTGSPYLSATFGASEAMTAFEVGALVEDQIGERWDEINPHGISLRQSLVPPQRMRFTHWFFRDGAVAYTNIDAWLVLEERPKTPDGYKIFYDEQTGKFGLALRGWYNDPYLSVNRFYGDFWSAFNAMELQTCKYSHSKFRWNSIPAAFALCMRTISTASGRKMPRREQIRMTNSPKSMDGD